MTALFAFLHHVAAFTLVACLFSQLMILSLPDTPTSTRLLRNIDAAYGLAAISLLLVGGIRVGFLEKTWGYYQLQTAFWIKLVCFTLAGLLSIYPTLQFLRRAKMTATDLAQPEQLMIKTKLRGIKALELVLVLLIIWHAICLAKGLSYLN